MGTAARCSGLIWADPSTHWLLSDLASLLYDAPRMPVIVSGDRNILYGYGEFGNAHWARRYAGVFERAEAMVLVFVGPQASNGRQAEPRPEELPTGSLNVETYHTKRQGGPDRRDTPARLRARKRRATGSCEDQGSERSRGLECKRPLPALDRVGCMTDTGDPADIRSWGGRMTQVGKLTDTATGGRMRRIRFANLDIAFFSVLILVNSVWAFASVGLQGVRDQSIEGVYRKVQICLTSTSILLAATGLVFANVIQKRPTAATTQHLFRAFIWLIIALICGVVTIGLVPSRLAPGDVLEPKHVSTWLWLFVTGPAMYAALMLGAAWFVWIARDLKNHFRDETGTVARAAGSE